MPFLTPCKTDFVRFRVTPSIAVSWVWFPIDFRIFSGRGHSKTVFLSFCLFVSLFFLFAAVSLRVQESCLLSSESEARLFNKYRFMTSHPSSSISVILNNFCCLRKIFLLSVKFSWHLYILPFSIAFIASFIFLMVFALYQILFPLFLSFGTVECALFKVYRMICLIVLTAVALISAMILFLFERPY